MKIAMYQPWIYLHGGLERTILELVSRSRHTWTIFTGHYNPQTTFPGFLELDVRTLRATSVNRAIGSVFKSAAQVAMQKLPLDGDVDALVVCCDGIGDLITLRNRSVPIYNLCFTPLRAAFDPIYEKKALSVRPLWGRLLYHTMKNSFRVVDRLAWSRYQQIIAISEEVKSRIAAGKLCDPSCVRVAHPGIDWPLSTADVEYNPFVLIAGRIMWTKNIELAISSFLAATPSEPWKLVIAGYVDTKSEIYLNTLRSLANGSKQIEFVISPSDQTMKELFRTASFCLFTAFNEDWGIAPLEAMCQAKPVIAVNSGGPRETIIDGRNGYLLSPVIAEWSQFISRFIDNPCLTRRLGENAWSDVRRFTWERFVTEVDDLIEHWLLADGSRSLQHDSSAPVVQNIDLAG